MKCKFTEIIHTNSKVASSFPDSWMLKSDKQIRLEANGCEFRGQEPLDKHEPDASKKCYCGRPNRNEM